MKHKMGYKIHLFTLLFYLKSNKPIFNKYINYKLNNNIILNFILSSKQNTENIIQ